MMRLNEKAIIFDMDGTLVDNIRYHEDSWIVFLKEYGIDLDVETFAPQNHGTLDEMIIRFFGNDVSKERLYELGIKKEEAYQNLYRPDIKEINGLTAFLQKLNQKNIKTGLATMGIPASIDFILNGLNIRNYFNEITGGLEVIKGKPNPEIFLKSIEKLQVDVKNAIAIEDSMGGIKAAKDAGLKVIGITTTHSEEELMDNGCFQVINDYSNIEIA
ncbi:HAD superfamily hydrolase (TIGR01509 family) [Chryseobacterium ginsenosidimutans]|uniref:HAD family hydrolase n=1 Tax=Chryseobacterium ginsenosidimutans TaxID=687846 RepID=UPI002169BCCC|nr:HAD family phosphatase [Chryseobacterium ginsenosidimutans]MCS3868165.1 HAD superfamily hydrolase (TIGR01509 family) [Chryseobacterium ginsenosidimutans]